jgi:hypothetical protein
MGTFPAPLPPTSQHISTINMISTMAYQSYESYYSWVVPSPLEFDALGDAMTLSPVEASYNAIQSTSPSLDDQHLLASNTYSLPSWLDSLSSSFDYILRVFPSDEYIMEMLSIDEVPWDDNHHRSSFLPSLDEIEKDIHSIFPDSVVDSRQSPILTQDTTSEGNLGNISSTISIDISIKEGIVENVHLDANCFPKEVEAYTRFIQIIPRCHSRFSMTKISKLIFCQTLRNLEIIVLINFRNA